MQNKRPNPFARHNNQQVEEIQPVEENEKKEEEIIEEEHEEVREVRKTTPKPQLKPVQDDEREKFTATMDSTLRRRIKIVCATRGIMFSQFIEDACREKLRREGER